MQFPNDLNPSRYLPEQAPGKSPDQSHIERQPFYRGRRGGVLALVILVVVVAGAAIISFSVVPLMTQGAAQMAAVRQFCADEVNQDYTAAYGLLSSSYTHSYDLDQAQFVQTLQQRDQRFGPVLACTITGRDYVTTLISPVFGEPDFVFRVAVTLGTGGQSGTITLANDHGWKVRYIDAQLHLGG